MPICITGMHRSGTSMVARLLNLCGLYLGPQEKIMPPQPDNPKGFWENLDFVQLNDEILARLGGGWDFLPSSVTDGWELEPAFIPLKSRAAEVAREFVDREPWGWKDPRTSLAFPFWKSLFPNLKVVICLRNPLEVALSLRERNNSSIPFGLNLWLTYNQRLSSVTRPEDRVVTHYEAYFANPQDELRCVLRLLDLRASDDEVAHACSTISVPLRHNRFTTSDLVRVGASPEILNLYRVLCTEAGFTEKEVVAADGGKSGKAPVDVSIIIPVFNQLEYTKQCLEALTRNTPSELYEVVIVNNGSTDGTSDFLRREESAGSLRAVFNPENLGFAKACNQGAQIAQGQYILFLNNDTVPQPGWLEAMISMAESDPQIGIVGSRLLYPDGTIQHAGIAFTDQGLSYHVFRGAPGDYPAALESRDWPAVTGACLLIRRDLFQRLGGFDEDFHMYVEDLDLCLRAWEKGFRVAYCPTSVLIHFESASATDTARRDAQVRAGWQRLQERWAGRWPAQVWRLSQQASLVQSAGTRIRKPRATPLWHAPIYDPSGYADEARNFISHLQAAGIEIAAREIGRHSPTFRNQLDPQTRHQLDRALRQEVGSDFISIVHFPAYAFQRLPQAAYNIGRVMFETDGLPAEWVAKCNQMDEIWVPTDFNLQTFQSAGVTAKLFKVPGGIDADRFRSSYDPLPIPGVCDVVFLSIFEWIYRKGWDVLLRAWAKAFRSTDNVSLALRTYPVNATDVPDSKQEVERRVNRFLQEELGLRRDEVAPIIVLGEQVPEEDMPRLFAAADAYVAPSRGEGWGRPQMAAMACGLPVIATRWSGNLEFMNDENAYLIDIEGLVEIDERAEIPFYRGQRWAQPSVEHLTELMRHVYDHPDAARAKGRRARRDMVEKWTWDHAARLALQRLEAISNQLSVISDQSSVISHRLSAIQPSSHPAIQPPSHPAIQPPSHPATQPSANLQSPTIRWEGSQFVTHSLALVNRELCIRLTQDPDIDLSIIPYEPHQFGPDTDPRFEHIVRHLNRPLSRPADVHVRHQWPPNFTPPPEGHWVIIQPWEFGSLPKRWVEVMSTQVDEVWVPSNYVRKCYIRSGIPADRVHVVPNGVDTTRFRPDAPPLALKTQKHFKFLFVGGTIGRKGIDVLLDAYMATFTADDDVCLVIKDMGGQSFYKGQTAQDMIAQCRNMPDAPEIEYIDRMLNDEELAGLYTACDCLVHPYRGEGFGLPIAEAMSSGRPVIVTGHGAALDFCTPETAYLIPAREVRLPQKHIGDLETVDYPWWADPDREALQQLMRHVVANPAEARAKGQAARACIQANFTWDHAAKTVRQRIAALCQRPIRRFASVDASDGDLTDVEQALAELFAAGQAALDRDDPSTSSGQRLETAAGEFARLTEQAPDLAAGHTALGSTLMALGRVEEAIPALRRATELVPQEPALHNQLGIALYQVGELEAAEEAFRAALRVSPADVDALLNLIEIYRAQDRYVEATECIKQAMQVAPNDVGVLTAFGTLSLELGDTEAARSALQHLQALAPDQSVVQALGQALGDMG